VFEDVQRCLRAVRARDARFDGWFYAAVITTGIYCRPSCPVRPPKAENMRFYPSAAAAQQAGFRACRRCRPDASPGSPQWNERADLVARAMRLIADAVTLAALPVGFLARALADGSVDLGVGSDWVRARAQLTALGIDDVTVETIAKRALGDPDAFSPSFLAKDLVQRSAAWRPWRAYATQYLTKS
jgi:hypothetical protein